MKKTVTAILGSLLTNLRDIYYRQCRIPKSARRMLRDYGAASGMRMSSDAVECDGVAQESPGR